MIRNVLLLSFIMHNIFYVIDKWYIIIIFTTAHHDQQALLEKMEATRRELDEERAISERQRREAAAKMEQDRANINQLRDELARIKTKMEEAR